MRHLYFVHCVQHRLRRRWCQPDTNLLLGRFTSFEWPRLWHRHHRDIRAWCSRKSWRWSSGTAVTSGSWSSRRVWLFKESSSHIIHFTLQDKQGKGQLSIEMDNTDTSKALFITSFSLIAGNRSGTVEGRMGVFKRSWFPEKDWCILYWIVQTSKKEMKRKTVDIDSVVLHKWET